MAQIRSQRKKNFFGHFSGRPKFYLKLRLGSSNAVWMFILPTVHPFLRLNLSYDTSPERKIHNLEDWLLRIGKIILYKRVLRLQNSWVDIFGMKKNWKTEILNTYCEKLGLLRSLKSSLYCAKFTQLSKITNFKVLRPVITELCDLDVCQNGLGWKKCLFWH